MFKLNDAGLFINTYVYAAGLVSINFQLLWCCVLQHPRGVGWGDTCLPRASSSRARSAHREGDAGLQRKSQFTHMFSIRLVGRRRDSSS